MTRWAQANPVGAVFLSTLIFGLIMITAAAFTVGLTIGLLTLGVGSIAGGHWVTYLKTTGAGQ